ncbi:uncharacterized protein LOC117220339 [Megalopta genalis]|uniref:uncharacterized protein LOC117220339 n=1 Tax=Megalopta genalis TaxID=115081 RepID=UPI001442E768|nr:uncharacterized protein LOC117220339 [Megalopta genalis]
MDNINTFVEILQKTEAVCEKQFEEKKKKQNLEYNHLMNTLKAIRDERNEYKETFSKNLRRITTYKYLIHNLCANNVDSTPALPISHEHHRQTITFLSEAIDFTYESLQNANTNFDNVIQKNINSTDLINDIPCCTSSITNEKSRIKSIMTETKALQNSVNMLQENC